MRKSKPDRSTLLQYIYDYGISKTAELFKITEKVK